MTGFFDLSTPQGLREKLKRDLAKLRADPLSTDAAFNFFITAEHMLDWVYPKNANRQKRTDAKKASALLQVCSHLANGAKHFEVEAQQHNSVESSSLDENLGYFTGYFTNYFTGYFPGAGGARLIVNLKGEAAREFGRSVEIISLAEKVMEYWNNHSFA